MFDTHVGNTVFGGEVTLRNKKSTITWEENAEENTNQTEQGKQIFLRFIVKWFINSRGGRQFILLKGKQAS